MMETVASNDLASGPVRTCLATRQNAPKDSLIRFVIAPDGGVTPDLEGKLPGRGLYVSPNRDALTTAAKKGQFSRAAKQQVSVPADFASTVENLIAKRALDHLALARRAGAVIAGFEKVRARLKEPKPPIVFSARDGAADGRDKITRLAHAVGAQHFSPFDRAELAQVLGREDAVHTAIEIDAGFASLLRYAVWLDAMRNEADNPIATGQGDSGAARKGPKSNTI